MKRMPVVILTIVLTFVLSQGAEAVLLDFESLSGGGSPTFLQSAATEYASSGVTFSGGGTEGQPVFYRYSALDPDIATLPINNDWFILTGNRMGGGPKFDINIHFSSPVQNVSGDVIMNPDFNVTAVAYDSQNNVISSIVFLTGSTAWIIGSFNFTSAVGIDHIALLPDSDRASVGLDNLRFSVPESSTMLLLGSGLLGLVGYRRRRLKK